MAEGHEHSVSKEGSGEIAKAGSGGAASAALVDIGVNLDHRRFEVDRDAVVARAQAAGVRHIVLTGTSVSASQRVQKLAKAYALRSTAGVHPHEASSFDEAAATAIRSLADQPEVCAIGECGLDFDRDFSPRPDQERAFASQIEIAQETGLPLFLHERSAHERLCAILDRHPDHPRAVVHCFTGSEHELKTYLDRGLYIGVTGWVCDERRGQELKRLVPLIPAGRLMIETDAPFLTPRTLRPKPKKGRNEPAFVAHIARFVAELRGESFEELAAHTTKTARAFFGLSPT